MSDDQSDFDRVRRALPELEQYIESGSYGKHSANLTKQGNSKRDDHPVHGGNHGTNFSVNGVEWYCHRCDVGGGIYEWIAVDRGIVDCSEADSIKPYQYQQALEKAAREAGVDTNGADPEEYKRKQKKRKELIDVYRSAQDFYHDQLTQKWKRWLKNRYNIGSEAIEKYGIGFAPTNKDALYKHLKAQGYDESELVQSGLFVQFDSGDVVDLFNGRVVFPYLENDKPTFFAARKTEVTPSEDYEKAKYKKLLRHSENHEYISEYVDEPIFGVDTIDRTDSDRVIVTEGVTDAIRLDMEGFAVVSPITTSFKRRRVKDIARVLEGKDVVVVMDEDADSNAGLEGATKTASTLVENTRDANISVGRLPASENEDMDVADYLMDHDGLDFQNEVLSDTVPPYEAAYKWAGNDPLDIYKAALNAIEWSGPIAVNEVVEDGEKEYYPVYIDEIVNSDTLESAHLELDRMVKRNTSHMDGKERQRLYQEIIRIRFETVGTFFKDEAGELYYFYEPDGNVYAVEGQGNRDVSKDIIGLVQEETGISPGRWSRNLLSGVFNLARRHAPERELHTWAYFARDEAELYVSDFDGGYYAITPESIEWRFNGTDVYFDGMAAEAEVWEYIAEDERPEPPDEIPGERPIWHGRGDRVHRYLTNRINYDDDAALAPAQQRKQLYLHLHAMPFGSILRGRPIMAFIGNKGSGKTMITRSIMQLFLGGRVNESSMQDSQDDFLAMVVNSPFTFIDNYDTEEKWANDVLASVATGASVKKRELYTTSNLASYQPDTWLALTSRDPPFNRDDVADRTLVFRVKRLDPDKAEFVGEGTFLNQVTENRDEILSEYIENLQSVLQEYIKTDTDGMTSSHRMADWAIFAKVIAQALDVDDLNELLETMQTERANFALEDDRTARYVSAWIKQNPEKASTWRKAGEFLDVMKGNGDLPGMIEYDNAAGFGFYLNQHRDEYGELLGLQINDDRSPKEYAFDVELEDGGTARGGIGLEKFD